ncbi:MAG TPA: PEP-CTERM sorting domain-containing protein [Cellvibrio sp.]|nr:PEP-CTERM sorting domain-containing protein [Cellvibrio sp.]
MFSTSIKHISGLSATLALLLGLASTNVHATFIDFDDITAQPSEPFTGCFCGHILSNEYESHGLLFSGPTNWLIGGKLPDGTNRNIVLGLNGISLQFIGTLPNFVSFNIHAPLGGEASYMDVYGKNGYLFTHVSSGWQGSEEQSTTYIPNELVSISASENITGMYIYSFYGLRTGPQIDNLTFESRTVPEPSSLFLLALTLTAVFWKEIKTNKNFQPQFR